MVGNLNKGKLIIKDVGVFSVGCRWEIWKCVNVSLMGRLNFVFNITKESNLLSCNWPCKVRILNFFQLSKFRLGIKREITLTGTLTL